MERQEIDLPFVDDYVAQVTQASEWKGEERKKLVSRVEVLFWLTW